MNESFIPVVFNKDVIIESLKVDTKWLHKWRKDIPYYRQFIFNSFFICEKYFEIETVLK